jgi:SAM-dependent methyltransferase
VKSSPERVDVARRIPRTKEECEHVARYLWAADLVHGEVLDVACGTGYGSRVLARVASVTGVDRAQEAVARARARVEGAFLVADVPPIPFADDCFDFVVSFETVEHISEDGEFVREIRRVLRPGGRLLISTPNGDVSTVDGTPLNEWHIREYTLGSLKELLENAGLEVNDVYAQSFPPKVKGGHRWLWSVHGLTWALPGSVRRATRSLLGDSEVRALRAEDPAPAYWLLSATNPDV